MSTNEEKHSLAPSETEQGEIESPLAHLEPKMQRFIHLYLTGQYSNAQLAQLLDVHSNTILNWLKRPEVRTAISGMQDVTHEVVSQQMKAMTMKAMNRMRELMDSPIDGVALQAVKDVLDRSGHKAKQEVRKEVTVRTFEEKLSDIIDATIDAEWEEID